MKILLPLVLVASSPVLAQTPSTQFPEGAFPLSGTALQDRIAGKKFSVKPATDYRWRWQFSTDGSFYLNSGNFNSSGKWSVQDSKLCTEGRNVSAACNEIRELGTKLYLKRDSGEVVEMALE